MTIPQPPRLIIFDCDGVLVDSELISNRILATELTQHGLTLSPEDCRRCFTGISLESVKAEIKKDFGYVLPPDFESTIQALDAKTFELELKPISGIAEALRKIPVPVCVASSGSSEKIYNSLRITGLADAFGENLFSAAMVANGKPAPDLFNLAALRMATPAEHIVVIEDSAAGVRAAGLADMRVFGFFGASHAKDDPGYPAKLIDAGATVVFDDMSQLVQLLGF